MKDYFISCYLAAMLELSCLTGGVPHPQLGGKGTGAFKNPLQAAYLIQTLAYLKAAQDLGIKEQKLIFKPYGGKVKTAFDLTMCLDSPTRWVS